jgi:hypothetical protein
MDLSAPWALLNLAEYFEFPNYIILVCVANVNAQACPVSAPAIMGLCGQSKSNGLGPIFDWMAIT